MSNDPEKPSETQHEDSGRNSNSFANEEETELGIGENEEAALGYFFSLLGGVILWIVEDNNDFVRFHAMQNIALSVVYLVIFFVVNFVLSILSIAIGVGWIFTPIRWLVQLGIFFVVVFMIWQAYQGERYKLPVLGDFAEDQLE